MSKTPILPTKIEDFRKEHLPPKFNKKPEKVVPWQAVNIQTGSKDIKKAFVRSFSEDNKMYNFYQQKVEALFSKDLSREKAVVTLSVRSAFDLYLQARNFPIGSEIIMTGINIPDMVRVATDHGLVPVPLELNLKTMAPVGVDAFKNLITKKTVAVIFAYLYGIVYDISDYIPVAKEHNIDVLEDAAQCFRGHR